MEKEKRKKFLTVLKWILLVLVIVFALLGIFYFVNWRIYQDELKKNEETFDVYRIKKEPVEDEAEETSPSHDFNALWEENKDIYAYITVDGTKVDYPILTNAVPDYYLNRNLDLSEGYPACIYTNPVNSTDFSDNITVIYGHNMKNKTMFGSLHNFDDEDFCKEHTSFQIMTPTKLLSYQIFAVVNYNDDLITNYYPPTGIDSVSKFVTSMREEGTKKTPDYFDDSVSVTEDDKIVALSTCIGGQDDRRLLVVGKLVDTEEFTNPTLEE